MLTSITLWLTEQIALLCVSLSLTDELRLSSPHLWRGLSLLCFVCVVHPSFFNRFVSYLVDPASSHMLVSKIKPCMSKYKHLYTVKLRTAHYISYYLFDGTLLHGYP